MGRLASLALRLTDPAQIERTLFALSKIVGLVVRPLILLIFLRTGQPRLGEDFSLLLTATASSFIILNNQNFRVVYQYFLDRPPSAGRRPPGQGRPPPYRRS